MNAAATPQALAEKFWTIGKVPHDARTTAFLGRCESRTAQVEGEPYPYFQLGSGPTVLLVHGVHSNLGSMVAIADALVEQGYRVVVFDAPSHGARPGTMTDPREISRCIRAICEQLGEPHAIVGHSLGTLWALVACSAGVRAKTFVSISAPSTMRFLVDKFAQMYKLPDSLVRVLVKEIENRLGDGVWHDYSPSELVKELGMPGLVLHGTADDFVPAEHANALNASWPGSEVQFVDDVRHYDILWVPETVKSIAAHLQAVA